MARCAQCGDASTRAWMLGVLKRLGCCALLCFAVQRVMSVVLVLCNVTITAYLVLQVRGLRSHSCTSWSAQLFPHAYQQRMIPRSGQPVHF